MDKGTHGYIKYKKNKQLRDTISIALVGIIIFVIGYLLNDNSKNNVFTILAILLALPGAKMLVGYIVVAPYQSMNDKEYEQVCKVISPSIAMISDLVITSPDKVMNLDVVVVDDYQVIALLGKQGQDISYIQTYLMRTIKNQGYSFEVKVLTDFSEFLLRVKTLVTSKEQVPAKEEQDGEDTNNSERDEIINLLKTLNV
ncbi:hypothetical protein SAMN02746066_01184 [Anaerosporobacter mobilis DSM 15930]|uniref:Uncharacterized protein n=1 Tax=Anaerosporobacter mobilis DSM 15930 TaxID=1120996 RepID=A0A1M7GXH2_9FIRM|nr:hypothetical protein [Anaerosporobacter mobilis]SHM21112.1 hypothetical protein SAMN02746066_01184 [Anaerosporobacter mobilis DSM 15930]